MEECVGIATLSYLWRRASLTKCGAKSGGILSRTFRNFQRRRLGLGTTGFEKTLLQVCASGSNVAFVLGLFGVKR